MAPLEQGADLQEFAQNTGAHLFPKTVRPHGTPFQKQPHWKHVFNMDLVSDIKLLCQVN